MLNQNRSLGTDTFKTTCCYCGVGCGIVVQKDSVGILTVEGDVSHPANQGMLCSKGKNLHYTANDLSDRLLYPEMRFNRTSPRQRVSWDVALTRAAAVFKTFIDKYGPDSVAFYASGQCLTEEYYVVNKLIKGFIGSNNIDTNSRLCMSSAVVGYKLSLGEDCVPVSYEDIELCDVLFVTGANPSWCHPIIWRRVEQAKIKNPNLRIIVCDPRKTESAAIADLHLQIHPGTDITLYHAIGRILIEQGNTDIHFVRNHTEGFENYKANVFSQSIEEAATICGVATHDIMMAAHYIGAAKGFVSMWTMGLNQSVIGVNKNLALINLHLITGHIGKPGAGPFSLTGQPNAMGGREVGGLSNLLPAHRDLLNEKDRNFVEQFWKVSPGKISPKPGLTATEMFEALESGKLKAIWIMCTNPLISLPDVRRAEAALKNAKFVVVQEVSNKPETILYADVVLPAAAWAEKEGTMTNAGRYITHLDKIIDPPGEALPDAEIICRFARKMNFPGFDYTSSAEIFNEHAALTANTNIDISGLNYELLNEHRAVQWPFPKTQAPDQKGTARLFTDQRFYTPSGKAFIHTVSDQNQSEALSHEAPLILTTGRIRDQWHTRSKTGKVNKLNQHIDAAFVEIHPKDALVRQIKTGDIVEIVNARGNVRVKAVLSIDIKPGVVFMPMHWGKIVTRDLHRANNLTNNLVDPRSKEPDFKFTAVEIRAYQKPKQKIIIIGAGAGACGFVKSYRKINQVDPIEIFSKEDYPYYNRVLLPDYVADALSWDHLIKMTPAEEKEYNIQLHKGLEIISMDKTSKSVTDSKGIVHLYDVLILATGSRAAVLKDTPSLEGIFTMRSRYDADRFKSYIKPNSGRIVIVGGGLLGIEMAASLRESGKQITIIQRISRLMDRQLDQLGSQLLHEILINKEIDIYYNDEIAQYYGHPRVTKVKLKSGRSLDCQALIMAVGTQPNIELARTSGIACKRGVVVDEYMRTNDEHIFAIGEIAEFKDQLFGITAAAEEQAEIVARYLSGDIAAVYQGSLLMNILKVHEAEVCSLGEVEIPNQSGEYEEIIFIDKAKHYYKKCIVYKDRLIGAILIGDKAEFLEFRNLISQKIELSEKRLQLLRSGKSPEPVLGRLICSCNQVGEGNLQQKIKAGCEDLVQLCQLTGAGLGCGSCRSEVNRILNETLVPSKILEYV